jgi:tetratricopeptide (TPR) repeat protein
MTIRFVRNYLLFFRDALALLGILGCAIGLVVYLIYFACLFFFDDAWPTPASWWGPAILLVSAIVIAWLNFPALALTARQEEGARAYREGRFAEAELIFRENLRRMKSAPPDHPKRGDILEKLAYTTRAQGKYDDAISFGQQWIITEEKTWGSDFHLTIHAKEHLARVYLDIARYDQAQPLLEQALRTREAAHEKASLDLAMCLNALGRLWYEQGQEARAEAYARRAFACVQQVHGQASKDGVVIVNQLVGVCRKLGKIDEAETLARNSLALVENSVPPESHLLALALIPVGLVRISQGSYTEAEKLIRRAVTILEKLVGSDSPALAVFLCGLGQSLANEKWIEAEECFRRALKLSEEYFAPEHPDIATVLDHYAQFLQTRGRFDEADQLAHRAHQIREFHTRRPAPPPV